MSDTILGPMAKTITRNLLKFAAGNAIFCKGCNTIMDWKRTVIIEVVGVTTGKNFGTMTLCTKCADAALPHIHARRPQGEAKAGEPLKIETTDGRQFI